MRGGSERGRDRAINFGVRCLLGLALALPYRWRVPLVGWVTATVVAPLAGWRRRIRKNLAHVRPDLSEAEVRRLVREVPDNAGRTLAEIYSAREFVTRLRDVPIEGPGLAILDAAREAGRPAILVTAHFGNYEAPWVALLARGCSIAGLYRPMRNRHFNDHYVAAMEAMGGPVFPTGRHGLGQLLRHMRGGGMVGILIDVYAKHAPELDFIGQPAPTALSAAEMALRHGAPLVPVYGIRQPDGLSFRVVTEAPIPHGTPLAMTQALNDSLEAMVRAHMGQWFWIHRRWKPGRQARAQRRRADARIGP